MVLVLDSDLVTRPLEGDLERLPPSRSLVGALDCNLASKQAGENSGTQDAFSACSRMQTAFSACCGNSGVQAALCRGTLEPRLFSLPQK